MENGAYSIAAHEFGVPNKASYAYLSYVILFCISFWLLGNISIKLPSNFTLSANYKTIATLNIIISLIFLVLILFVFGGYKVILGEVDKGAFRIGFGFFGSIVHLMTKFFLPAILTLSVFYYNKETRTNSNAILLILNFILAFIFGASWGYKSTAIFILLPPLILLYQKPRFIRVLVLSLIAFASFIFFAIFFDDANDISTNSIDLFEVVLQENPIESVLYRLTVLQGDPCWKIWDLHVNGELKNVEYHRTIFSVIGDGNMDRFLGVNHENYPMFIKYHFGLLLTYLCGNEPHVISQGYNVTGTVFSEGIIAGGLMGLVLFSVFAGFLTRIVVSLVNIGITNNLPVLTSITTTYFCFNIFTWLNGGGIENLFHISVFIGLVLSYVILIILLNISKVIKL
jgi:hypothetical protein